MIITNENKYQYYNTIRKWIDSCDDPIQLRNIQKFVLNTLKQKARYTGTFELLNYYSFFMDIEKLIKDKSKEIS